MKKKNYLNPHLYEVMNDTDKFIALAMCSTNKYGKNAQQLMDGYKKFCNKMEKKGYCLSEYQTAIVLWCIFGNGNAMVNAVAGSGKSFTIKVCVEALHIVFSLKECDILVVQFNRAIAEANEAELKNMAKSKTMHSISYQSFTNSYVPPRYLYNREDALTPPEAKAMYIEIMEDRWEKALQFDGYAYLRKYSTFFASTYALATYQPTEEQLKNDPSLKRRIDDAKIDVEQYFANVIKLFSMSRINLIKEGDFDSIARVAEHFRIAPLKDEFSIVSLLLNSKVSYVARAFDASKQHKVSYDDMLIYAFSSSINSERMNRRDYLPTPIFVFGDESQDFNEINKRIISRMSRNGRCLCVGDPRQSINGFAGADTNAFNKTKVALNAVEFPLSVCYRCDKDIIALAQREVANITARENAEDGTIDYSNVLESIRPNDLLLFRKVANQIKVAMLLNRNGVLCRIKGGDNFQSMLENAIKVWKTSLMSEVIKKMENKLHRMARKVANDKKISTERAMQTDAVSDYADIVECVKVLANDCYSVEQALSKVGALFNDKIPTGAVVACTMHKSKGLEANRVWLMECPIHINDEMLPWEIEQEHNLWYVAVTRAKHELVWFDSDCDTFDFRNYKWDRSKMRAD